MSRPAADSRIATLIWERRVLSTPGRLGHAVLAFQVDVDMKGQWVCKP